jgi:hypothetical protein
MGKYLTDLDLRFMRAMTDCQGAYRQGAYRTAAQLLYQLNFHLPPEASIEDLPAPSIKSKGLYQKLTIDEQYRDYYEKYAPLIYKAIAQFNQDELLAYAQRTGQA